MLLPYISYHKLSEDNKADKSLPTLVIGWNLVNDLLPVYEHDILEKEIHSGNTQFKHYWEFSPTEDIIQYTQGLELFTKKIPYMYMSRYVYINGDPFFNNLFSVDAINIFLPDGGNLYIYKDEVVYYCVGNNIYGFKLSIFDYLGLDSSLIIGMLRKKAIKEIIDTHGEEYQKYYKLFPEFDMLKRSMVVFSFS
jgi:hypothetical protein